jgi:hypothetical protein
VPRQEEEEEAAAAAAAAAEEEEGEGSLTQPYCLLLLVHSVYLLYWYKSTNTDAQRY